MTGPILEIPAQCNSFQKQTRISAVTLRSSVSPNHRFIRLWWGRSQDLIAIKPHAHTSCYLRRTIRLDMDYMTRTAPFGRRLMCDLFWHLESEMHWRALAKGQIRCKVYAACRNI